MRYQEQISRHAQWIIILCFFIYGAATIMTFPPVHYLGDELGMMDEATRFMDSLAGGDDHNFLKPRLYYASLWAVISVFGEGIAQARALSLVCSALVLWLVYVLGTELGGRGAGIVALLVVAGDYVFAWNSRLIRPEMMTMLFVMGAFGLMVLALRRDERWWVGWKPLFGAGFLVALSVNVHPNNLQYAVAMSVLYPVLFRRRLRSKATVGFAAGLGVGVLFWMLWVYLPGVYYLPAQAEFSSGHATGVGSGLFSSALSIPLLSQNPFTLLWNALSSFGRDYVSVYLKMADATFPNKVTFVYYASVVGAALALGMFTHRRRAVVLLVGFPVCALFLNYFLTSKFGYWHMVEVHPFLAIAASVGVCSVSERVALPLRRTVITGFVCLLPLIGFWDQAGSVREFSAQYDYGRLLESVSATIEADSSIEGKEGAVAGHELYWPAFGQRYRPVGYDVEHVRPPWLRCRPISERLRGLGARFLLMDDILRGAMVAACGKMYFQDSMGWLAYNGRLVARVTEAYPNYWAPGRVLRETYVYKIFERPEAGGDGGGQ